MLIIVCYHLCVVYIWLQEALRVRRLKEKACLRKQKEEENRRGQLLQGAGMNSNKLMHFHKAQEDLHRKEE